MIKINSALLAGYIAALGLLTPATAGAQTPRPACTARGTVLDQTALPLPGVTVTAKPGGEAVVTDADGRFCLTDELAPKVTIAAALQGFQTAQQTIAGDKPAVVDFTLQASTVEEQIVVTATRTSRRLDEVPVRTEVVDTAQMRAIGARTLADAVEYTTGVRVESNCQNCNFSQIRLLGLEGPYTQILMDGQPVVSSLAQVYGIEQIPARMIDRIEIVKGGGSALYGAGSVGGVVNVISREPPRKGGLFESRVDFAGGAPSHSTSGSLDWTSRDRQATATGFLQLDHVTPLDVTGDGFTEVSKRNLQAGGGRMTRHFLNGNGKLTTEITRFVEDRRGGDALNAPPQDALIAEWIHSRRTGASATWFHGVSPSLDYRVTLAVADSSRNSYYGTGRDPNAFGATDNRLLLLDSQVNHYRDRHTTSWGAQLSSESLLDRQPAYQRLTDATYRNAGVFAQDDWSFAKGWELTYGLRADAHSAVNHLIVSPRVALMVSPRESLDIRASIAHGFRAPQAFDEDLHLSSVGGAVRFIRIDPNLREERSTNYMLGAEWKPEAGRGQAMLEINGFSTSLRDLFLARANDDPLTGAHEFLKTNAGTARVYGIEANAGWGVGDAFVLQGGVVFQRARFGAPEPDFNSRDFFRTPNRYGNFTATWRTGRWGDWFGGIRYTGSMKAPHYAGFIPSSRLETTSPFVSLDASVAYPIRTVGAQKLVLTIAGKNLGNAYQPDIDQGPLRDSAYVYGPRFPRSGSVGLRVEF